MFAKAIRSAVRLSAGALLVMAMFAAAPVSDARAATVAEFIANPAAVMAQSPNGGADLIALIRDVLTQRPDALQTVAGLLASANGDQQTAIGTGAGQAYQAVLQSNQPYATQIAAAIGNSNSDNAKTAYAAVTGDTLIGGIGGGGGGGGGPGGGSGGGTGSNPPSGGANTGGTTTGQAPTQTSGNTFTGGGSGVGSLSNSTPGATTTVSGR